MNKVLSLLVVLFLLASCSGKDKKEQSTKDIKAQIVEYKAQVAEIEEKIKGLEEQLIAQGEIKAGSKILVETKTMKKEHFSHFVKAGATLEAVNSAFISPEISGQIQTIHVNEGQFVKKGQLIVSLNADLINASIKELESSYQLAKTVFERQDELWKQKIGSEIQYLEAKNNKESLESKLTSLKLQRNKSKIVAPISGIVDKINLKKGELAMPGAQIVQLVNIGSFFVNADVSEKYIAVVKRGNKVTVTFPTFPDLKVETTVYRTGNIINSTNRTFNLQSTVGNIDNKLKPNMLATVQFRDFEVEDALVVPSIIVKEDFKGKYLYVAVEEDGKLVAHKKHVKTEYANDTGTMISDGLSEGDQVIVEGYNLVKDGMELEIKK